MENRSPNMGAAQGPLGQAHSAHRNPHRANPPSKEPNRLCRRLSEVVFPARDVGSPVHNPHRHTRPRAV